MARERLALQTQSAMANKNFSVFTSFPKIGIRPAIDGRYGGVRESLEDQTMAMAQSAAELISSSLRYPDGSPVVCIIADTCIGGWMAAIL